MAKQTNDMQFKLLLIGDSAVGKTSLLYNFSENFFTPCHVANIGIDFKFKTIDVDGKKIKLQLWDTAGQERFNTLAKSFYNRADGVMLVYDITNAKSFENISMWMHNLDEHAQDDVVKMIIGNKADKRDHRTVSKDLGEKIANEYGVRFLETSAKTNENVDSAFYTLAKDVLKRKQNFPVKISEDVVVPATENDFRPDLFMRCC